MKTLTVKLPSTIELDESELLLMLASRLYEKGKLSLGQAAELAGFSKRAFAEILGRSGVSIFNYSADSLDRDVENAKNYSV
jgi:predicted HTH domain antitoxin